MLQTLCFKLFLRHPQEAPGQSKKLRRWYTEGPRKALGGPCAQIVLLAAATSTFRRGVKSYEEAPRRLQGSSREAPRRLQGGSKEAPGIELYKSGARLASS